MKKIIISSLFCLIVSFVQAQDLYSTENLQKLSQEELELFMNKALKLKKTGKTLNIIGIGAAVLGTIMYIDGASKEGWDGFGEAAIGMVLMPVGGVSLAIGIPINITGKSRVNRINSIRNTPGNASINVSPRIQYNMITQNYQPAVVLSVRF